MIDVRKIVIKRRDARVLLDAGYYAVDLHCHTSFSYDVPDVKETDANTLVSEQQKFNLHPLISDHDTLNAITFMKKRGYKVDPESSDPYSIIPACELTIKPLFARRIEFKGELHTLHINIFGLNARQLEDIENIARKHRDLDMLVKYLRKAKLKYMYNHPFWHSTGEKLNWRAVPALAKEYFDVLELNATFPRVYNNLVLSLARQLGKGVIAASDTHIGRPGVAFTLAQGKNFDEFWENVVLGNSFIVRRDLDTFSLLRESSAMMSNVLRANTRVRNQRAYSPAIGIKPIDYLARKVTSGSLKNQIILKKLMHLFFFGINYVAGPLLMWKYFISKQNSQAESIEMALKRITKRLIRKPKSISKDSIRDILVEK